MPKKTKVFTDYDIFLKNKEEQKGIENAQLQDEGSGALYHLLFKLMGDKRSYEEMWSIDTPPMSSLEACGEEGDYADVISDFGEMGHNCKLEENGAKLEISTEIIEKLESFVSSLMDDIDSNWHENAVYAKECLDLNSILKE